MSESTTEEKTVQNKLDEYINDLALSKKIKDEFVEKNKNVLNYDKIYEMVEERKG